MLDAPASSATRSSSQPLADDNPYIAVTAADIVENPFPHALKQGLLKPDFYERLKKEFPPDSLFDGRGKKVGARTGRDLYQGDRGFDEFLDRAPAWREFHEYVSSPAFLAYTLELFGPHLERFGCRIDPEKARLVDYVENRFNVFWRKRRANWFGMGKHKDPNNMFVRFDIEQSAQGYAKPVHCDNPSRLVSFLVYFSDADEIGMDGGDLRIHEHLEKKRPGDYERHPKEQDTRVVQTLRPRENLGLFFLCCNNSYHSVTAVNSIKDYRRFIYLNLSSTAESIW